MIKKSCNGLNIFIVFYLVTLLGISPVHAKEIIILPNTTIEKPTEYKNVTLDMSKGNFIITNHATLLITNSMIKGTVSPDNHYLFHVARGVLQLNDNTVKITADRIIEKPTQYTNYKVIKLTEGKIQVENNIFDVDKPYSVGFLTTGTLFSSGFSIINNRLRNFHSGLVLLNNHDTVIADNHFNRVSLSNIFMINGSNNRILNNTILFAGNNNVGDAIDLFDSRKIDIINNQIIQDSCYSIYILRSDNILIKLNKIIGGITYAIYLGAAPVPNDYFYGLIKDHLFAIPVSSHIIISDNLLVQNRFGLGASLSGPTANDLIVNDNTFIQRFSNDKDRKQWTNNDVLLSSVTHVTWENNLYKEAFSQDIRGDNALALKFVPYPAHGGINLV